MINQVISYLFFIFIIIITVIYLTFSSCHGCAQKHPRLTISAPPSPLLLLLLLTSFVAGTLAATYSVTDYGAKGDGITNDTQVSLLLLLFLLFLNSINNIQINEYLFNYILHLDV